MIHPLFNMAAVMTAVISLAALSSPALAQTAATTTPGATTTTPSSTTSTTTSTAGTTTAAVGTGTAIGPTLLPVTSGPTLGPGIAGGFTPYQPAGLPTTTTTTGTTALASAVATSGVTAYQPANAYGGIQTVGAPITETDPSIAAGINYTLQAGVIAGPQPRPAD